ncbi:MAG TPA: MraY family glycosyltransferase [Candidatus Eisenbacteria bacterium]|nr:MraY family glycosyltransferase [Candidatus Eisenbacteria bacterium]
MNGPFPFLVVAPLAFASALLLTPALIRVARATGYLDHPDPRKSHAEPTPLLGGVAVALALLLAAVLARVFFPISIAIPRPGFWIGAVLSLGMGLLDDRRPMPPLGKLGGQLAAALCLVLWGPQVEWIRASPLTLATAILGVVALLNAINFLDAMDGIVGAVVPITAAGFVAIGILHGAPVDLILAWGLVGGGAGFLVYNAPPARIFLGDAGSHFLGFALAALALEALQGPPTIPHLAAVALLLSYPLFDVIFVIVVRIVGGRPIYLGGVDHTTHRLGRRCGKWGALGIVAAAVTLNVCLGAFVWGLSEPQPVIAAVLISGLGYAIFGAYLGRIGPTP